MNSKRFLFFFIALFAVNFLLMTGCTSSEKPAPAESAAAAQQTESSGDKTLDQAIAEAAARIEERVTPGSKIALLNFDSPSDRFSSYVLDELSVYLVDSGNLIVVDRKEMDLIRSEMNFQMSGDVSENSMQALGQKIGAQSIVSGSLTDIGGSYRIMFRVLSVETAIILVQFRTDIAAGTRVQTLLGSAASVGTQTATGGRQTAAAPAQPAQPAIVYKIGDTGPAGGIIFYDKGNNSGGWRYLEAAPEDINRKLNPVSEPINASGSAERGVGMGKRNTEAIMKEAANKGGGFGWAAQACDAYELNGFNDWFLPSRDELHHMYGNLHMQGIGGFRNEHYWSSTAGSNGTTDWFWRENFANGEQQSYRHEMRVRPVRQFAEGAVTPPAQTQTAASGAFKVGGKGPAGGIIFYDKGNNNGGWRYLEAAPADINRKLNPVSEPINASGSAERAVGWGKRNTEAIMKEAARKGGGFGWAAQACDAYELNGFKDWFLPSRDELHHMYGNLHMQGIGDFRNEHYWSSTAGSNGTTDWFWRENFANGEQQSYRHEMRVRPVRQFADGATTPPPAPPPPVPGTFMVGEKGPAGGLIFYDKGNSNGGWRYLEAAPADINRKLNPVSESIDASDCAERGVGWGKRNTEAIMKEAASKGGGFGWAAQACDAYTHNGFDDWFLPSRDELHYMYGNLHMQGIGNFRNEHYWSSTAGSTGKTDWFWRENFANGEQQSYRHEMRVRPVRQF